MALKALLLAALVSPAAAHTQVGEFQLEPHSHQAPPVVDQQQIQTLKEKASKLARRAATYLNTHPVIGNPDLPEKYRDILPHEVFGKLKESFEIMMREKLRERDHLTQTNL